LQVLDFLSQHFYLMIAAYVVVFLLLVLIIYKIYLKRNGHFGQTNLYRRLKKLYKEKDYPWIKEIILPINDQQYLFYDAIVFGDKHIYLIEMKNQHALIHTDKIDDWSFQDKKNKAILIPNAFYDLDLKTHILNKLLQINTRVYIPVIVYNNHTQIKKPFNKNRIISVKQVSAFINHHEQASKLPKMSVSKIEELGKEVLDENITNYFIRRKVLGMIKNQRLKR